MQLHSAQHTICSPLQKNHKAKAQDSSRGPQQGQSTCIAQGGINITRCQNEATLLNNNDSKLTPKPCRAHGGTCQPAWNHPFSPKPPASPLIFQVRASLAISRTRNRTAVRRRFKCCWSLPLVESNLRRMDKQSGFQAPAARSVSQPPHLVQGTLTGVGSCVCLLLPFRLLHGVLSPSDRPD